MNDLFAPLPDDFHQLALAAQAKRSSDLGKEVDLRTVGERTYSAFEAVNFSPLSDKPRPRDWRHIPYALWLKAERGLSTHTPLVDHYFEDSLMQGLQSRRPLKWGRGLLHTYFQNFNPQDPVFAQLAKAAHYFFSQPHILDSLSHTEAHGLGRLISVLEALDPIRGPIQLANDLLGMPEDRTLEQWQQYHAVTHSFWLNPFARQAFGEALQAPESLRQTLPYIQRITQWALHDAGAAHQRFRYPVLRDEYAWALLSPWFNRQPPAHIQQALIKELVKTLGDPRHDHAGWLGVRKEAIEVASRWLSGRTMETFFEILRHTQDEIGTYRRHFWQAYYNAGHILEAWIALGEEAAAALALIDTEQQLQYAKILGKISPNQCVLMIRMGDLLFCDWSHKGRLRAISVHAKQAPKLYQAQYELFELRFPTPLDFNGGLTDDPGLLHHDSARGGWQAQASAFIAQHLQIEMPLADLLPRQTT